MASVPHYLEQQRLISSKGVGYGGSIYFYYTGSLVKAPIYSDSELTTPVDNPVVVAAGAIVSEVWLDAAITYRRLIVYTNGDTEDLDPYVSGPVVDSSLRSELLSSTAGKGGDLVTFLAEGTGAVGRTVTDRMREVVFVTDFDTIQNAYAGGNKTVVWPADTYDLSTYVRIEENTRTFFMPGTVIRKTGSSTIMFGNLEYGDTSTVLYEGPGNISFDGSASFVLSGAGTNLKIFGFCHSKDISIKGSSVVTGMDKRHAIEMNACKNWVVDGWSFINQTVVSGDEDVSEVIQYDGALDPGRLPGFSGASDGTTCEDFWIQNCYFENIYTAYGTHGDAVMTNRRGHFLNNTIVGSKHDGEHLRWLDGAVATGQIIKGSARRATLTRQSNRVVYSDYIILDPSTGNAVSAVFFQNTTNCLWGISSISYTSTPSYTRPIEIGPSGGSTTGTIVYEGNSWDGTAGGLIDNAGDTIIIYGKSGKVLAKTQLGFTGTRGSVVQSTNKSTAVTMDAPTGVVEMNAAALAAGTAVTFQLNNTSVANNDQIVATHHQNGTFGSYTISARASSDGVALVTVRNNTGSSLSENIKIKISVIKA